MRLAGPIWIRSHPQYHAPDALDLWTEKARPSARLCRILPMPYGSGKGLGPSQRQAKASSYSQEAANVPIQQVHVQIHVSIDLCTCENVLDRVDEAGPDTLRSECCTCCYLLL